MVTGGTLNVDKTFWRLPGQILNDFEIFGHLVNYFYKYCGREFSESLFTCSKNLCGCGSMLDVAFDIRDTVLEIISWWRMTNSWSSVTFNPQNISDERKILSDELLCASQNYWITNFQVSFFFFFAGRKIISMILYKNRVDFKATDTYILR